MKRYILSVSLALLSLSCNGQNNETQKKLELKANDSLKTKQPEGSWKVNKEFDEHGSLIRYDSVYSWSSQNYSDDFSRVNKDSLLHAFKSRFFSNFSEFKNEGFHTIFSQDSLFSKRFFNDNFFGSNFGREFMDIDSISQNMIARQRQFLEKYQLEFMNPKNEKRIAPGEKQ